MGDSMIKNVFENKEKNQLHIDKSSKDKMNFRVVNHYPENKVVNTKDIEKRLFDIFKKYEKTS